MQQHERVTPGVEFEKPLQERCGIVVLFDPEHELDRLKLGNNGHTIQDPKLELALRAGQGVRHRGQNGAGIAYQTEGGLFRHTGDGILEDVFTPDVIEELPMTDRSRWVMVHTRYGTYGGYEKRNLQPCVTTARDGTKVAVIHNGEFAGVDAMRGILPASYPEDISDTYFFAQMLAEAEGENWDEKVLQTLDKVNGAYSLGIGINDTVYLARDQFGIRPLILAKMGSAFIAASETFVMDKLGIAPLREIHRGEVLKLDKHGVMALREGEDGRGNFCDFEWDYFSRPESLINIDGSSDNPSEWLSVLAFREECGKRLAVEKPVHNASFVVGVPDSGVAVATGYANALYVPYRQVILRDHSDESANLRLFMNDKEEEQSAARVLGKLSFVPDPRIWKDAVVVVGDDSVIRSHVSSQVTRAIFALGAKEVHWRVGFPPVRKPCHLGVSMRSEDELVAARYSGDEKMIARAIGATSVGYISPESFVSARTVEGKMLHPQDAREIFIENGGCGGCVTGLYPISREGVIYEGALRKERELVSVG